MDIVNGSSTSTLDLMMLVQWRGRLLTFFSLIITNVFPAISLAAAHPLHCHKKCWVSRRIKDLIEIFFFYEYKQVKKEKNVIIIIFVKDTLVLNEVDFFRTTEAKDIMIAITMMWKSCHHYQTF